MKGKLYLNFHGPLFFGLVSVALRHLWASGLRRQPCDRSTFEPDAAPASMCARRGSLGSVMRLSAVSPYSVVTLSRVMERQ